MILILRFLWGFDEKEIGECCGFSESRVSQKLNQLAKEISGRISSEEYRRTTPQKPREIPQQIQTGPGLSQESRKMLEEIRQRKGAGLGLGALSKIPKIKWQRVLFQTRSQKKDERALQEMGKEKLGEEG